MLPKTHHEGDRRYIQAQLARLPYSYRAQACEGYSKVWQEAHDAEPEMRHKENRARFAANTRLREFTEKVLAR